jgi:hypothetical protein
VLLQWWTEQNTKNRNLWPGNFTSRIDDGSKTEWQAEQLIRQIEATREQPGATGNIHFSIKALAADRDGVATKLKKGVYAEPALVPASPWLAEKTPLPSRPKLSWSDNNGGRSLTIKLDGDKPWQWVIRERSGDRWTTRVLPGHTERISDVRGEEIVASAVNRVGVEGPAARAEPPSKN